jgi:hypothetical protein
MHDQTDIEWLVKLGSESERGTGIFLIPAVEDDTVGAARKTFVRNITYDDCRRRGASAMAFKWVPQFIAAYESLVEAVCGGAPCEETCSRQQPGCLCNRVRRRCE